MKPEQLTERIAALDTEAREKREEQQRLAARRRTQDGVCAEMNVGIEERLNGFRTFLRTAAGDPASQPAHHGKNPADEPIVLEILIGERRGEELGLGQIIATVVAKDGDGYPITRNTLDTVAAVDTAFSFRPQNEFMGTRDGNREDTELGSEHFSTGLIPRLNGIKDVDQREQLIDEAARQIAEADVRAADTLVLLEAAARDTALNPELAERFAAHAPLPGAV